MDPADDQPTPTREGRHRDPGNKIHWDFGRSLRVYLLGLVLAVASVGYGIDRLRGCGGTCQQSVLIGLGFVMAPILIIGVAVAVVVRRG